MLELIGTRTQLIYPKIPFLLKLQNKKIAVLGYHKIGPPPDEWYTWSYISAAIFQKQMEWLRDNSWQVLTFEQFLSGLDDFSKMPEKSVLITFDDGYRSNLTRAVPVLKSFGYPAVMFVPTAFVGTYNAFDADIFYEPKEEICSWEELKELERSGVSIQSHSVSHPHFSNLTNDELKSEIVRSKKDLEEKLGKRIDAFSFPYGDIGRDEKLTEQILSGAGYRVAFLFAGDAFYLPITSSFKIQRLAIGEETILKKILGC